MAASVQQLGPDDAERLRAFLAQEPIHNIYLLGLLEEFGVSPRPGRHSFAFHALTENGALRAALFVGGRGGLVVPSASDPAAVAAIAQALGDAVQMGAALGDQAAVDGIVRYFTLRRPRYSRAQRLFAVSADDLGPFTNPTLRLATEADFPRVLPLAVGAVRETFDRDPMQEDPSGFQARVLQRIRAKRTYVFEEEQRLVFKLDIGSRSRFGAELEGLYTVPADRRRGHATLSLGQISRHLLSSLPRLTLRVDERNPSLAGVARKVGYVGGKSQRLIVVE
jgi:hypothetical protein